MTASIGLPKQENASFTSLIISEALEFVFRARTSVENEK